MQNQFKARLISNFHQFINQQRIAEKQAEKEGFLASLYEGTERAITHIQVSVFVLVLDFFVSYVMGKMLSDGLSCKWPGLVNDTRIHMFFLILHTSICIGHSLESQ